MFYRNLLLFVGVLSLLVAIVVSLMTGTETLVVSPTFLFWYLMGVGTVMVVGGALADLWTRSFASLRTVEKQVGQLSASLQRVTGGNPQVAAASDASHEKVSSLPDAE